jgi:hypothetical protein
VLGSRRKKEHVVLEAFDIGVSGERHYGEGIRSILREHGGGRLEYRCTATIRRDHGNAYDPNAVEVVVHGLRVGYISERSSRRVAERIKQRSVELECMVSWNGEINNGIYHVKLFPVF